jgi:hypothetical protein
MPHSVSILPIPNEIHKEAEVAKETLPAHGSRSSRTVSPEERFKTVSSTPKLMQES